MLYRIFVIEIGAMFRLCRRLKLKMNPASFISERFLSSTAQLGYVSFHGAKIALALLLRVVYFKKSLAGGLSLRRTSPPTSSTL
jgi:hypothetical protein